MVMCLPAVPPDPVGGGGERRGDGEDVDGHLVPSGGRVRGGGLLVVVQIDI